MKISDFKKGMSFNEWTILSDISKIRENKQTKYYATVKCPNCGNEYYADLNPIFYSKSKKCKECHKPQKYKNIYVEKEFTVELHFMNKVTNTIDFISTIDKKYIEEVKKYSWGIGYNSSKYPYVMNTRNNRVEKNHERLHRFVCGLEYGFEKLQDMVVDHINRNTLDNRVDNLNIVKHFENVQNTKLFKSNKSGVKGVVWRDKYKKWEVSIQLKGKRHYLGSFIDKEEAIKIRKDAEKKYHEYYSNISNEVL